MRVSPKILGSILTDLAATKERRRAFGRVMEVRPEALSLLIGSWYELIGPWKKNVDEFDRRLLGILGERRIGLHFSSATWQIPVEQDPSMDALRAGEHGELHYYAIDPEAGAPRFLNQFPSWGKRGRNHLIVIDREQAAVKQIGGVEAGPESLTHVILKAQPFSPVFGRSAWLVREPIPLLNSLDIHQPEKMTKFAHLGLVYQSRWQHVLEGAELFQFYIMLFSVANGLTLLDALKALTQPAGRRATLPITPEKG
ncbi:MAG: hypothetical protein PHH60_01440 [Candidatus Margulisbacteria bacterium]|nr:hypothetical protein [Candidatus Margulisiibacteriota bacterium]